VGGKWNTVIKEFIVEKNILLKISPQPLLTKEGDTSLLLKGGQKGFSL
jgi:hypothetical protein